jgi:hypothetical protein
MGHPLEDALAVPRLTGGDTGPRRDGGRGGRDTQCAGQDAGESDGEDGDPAGRGEVERGEAAEEERSHQREHCP